MRHRRVRRFPKRLFVASVVTAAMIIATGTAGAAVLFGGDGGDGGATGQQPATEAASMPFGAPHGPSDIEVQDAEQRRSDAGDGSSRSATGSAEADETRDGSVGDSDEDVAVTSDADSADSASSDSSANSDGSDGSDESDDSASGAGQDDSGSAEESEGVSPTGEGGTCAASTYSEPQPTASGEQFDPDAMTAAHKELPFDTMVEVTNSVNGASVTVRINDRGPYVDGRCLDLSRAAFERIASPSQGVATVDWQVVE